MLNIAVLVSGGGTNLQALINAQDAGILHSGKIKLVLSSNAGAYALQRAAKHGIASCVVSRKSFATSNAFDTALLAKLEEYKIDIVVLAGFLSILGKKVIAKYPNRIINVHPSLIPSFCGDGFYGLKVHQAALEKGVKVSGATVHFVNEITDGGEIIAQKAVNILPDDTPESLQKRIMEQAEWVLLPQAVEQVCQELQQA